MLLRLLFAVFLALLALPSRADDICKPGEADVCTMASDIAAKLAPRMVNDPKYKGEFPTISLIAEREAIVWTKKFVHTENELDALLVGQSDQATYLGEVRNSNRKLFCSGPTLSLIYYGGRVRLRYLYSDGSLMLDIEFFDCSEPVHQDVQLITPGMDPALLFTLSISAVEAALESAIATRDACIALVPAQAKRITAAHDEWRTTNREFLDFLPLASEAALRMIAEHDKVPIEKLRTMSDERRQQTRASVRGKIDARPQADIDKMCEQFPWQLKRLSPRFSEDLRLHVGDMMRLGPAYVEAGK